MRNTVTPITLTITESQILNLKVLRTPSMSRLPKYCAPKIEAPETPPKIVRLNQLIHNRHAGHRFSAELPNHNVIKQVHEIRNALLNYHRYNQGDNTGIKSLCTEKASDKTFSLHFFSYTLAPTNLYTYMKP